MGAVRSIAVCGPAAPQVSWERYAELAQWPTWAPQISGVDADEDHLRAGLTGQVRTAIGLSVLFVVTDVDAAAMTWSWLVWVGPIPLTLHHGVTPRGTGARASLTIEGPGPVVTAYTPFAWWALRNLVR